VDRRGCRRGGQTEALTGRKVIQIERIDDNGAMTPLDSSNG